MTSNNPFDQTRTLLVSLYMTLVGYGVLVGIPVISTAWVTLLGFSEVEVGRVAGADLGGLSAGAVLAAILIAQMNRRVLIVLGLTIAVAANLLCLYFVDYSTVLWLRLLAGLGSGIYTATAVAALGARSNPALAYNLMLFAFAFSQALEMQVLPLLSMNGIYLTFVICFLVTLPFLGWMPTRANAPSEKSVEDKNAAPFQNTPVAAMVSASKLKVIVFGPQTSPSSPATRRR
ncbi:MAG: MFS transporter [Pseudomonadales bacterium]